MSSMSSPPPTPSSALPRLNANSSAFVPGGSAPKKITLKNVDGTEVNIETLKSPLPPTSATAAVRPNLPVTPTRKAGTVRIETPEQRQKRLEEEEQKEKSKADAEEKARKEKEEEVKKQKDEEERKKKEEEQERIRKEEAEKERLRQEEKARLRKEEEEKERLRKEEEERERLRKEEEEKQRLKREEEEKERLKEEEEEKERLRKEAEEKDRQRKEEEDRQRREDEEKERKEEAERIRIAEEKAREEEERLKREAEDRRQQEEEEADKAKTAAEDEAELEAEVEGIKMTDSPVIPEAEEGELSLSKDDVKEKSAGSLLRIDTTLRRRPGPLDLSHSRQPSSPLTLARPLEDLGSVTYPAGISSPNPELNAGAKEGKFRYVDRKSCAAVVNPHSFAGTIASFCCNSCPFARKNQNLFLLWTRLAWNL